MNFSLYIAKRYLFTKTSNNAINIITIIASFGVIVGSLALFIILSGFSGLRTFSYSLLDASDPDIKISVVKGKSFFIDDAIQQVLDNNTAIKASSKIIEERVFLEYKDKNEIAYIKGVEENYAQITNIDSSLSVGNWLENEYLKTAVIGRTIAAKLSLGVRSFGEPLSIMIPKPGTGFINPTNAFYKTNVQIVGLYTGTEDFESKFVFVNLEEAKRLLRFKENQVTAIELKLTDNLLADEFAEELQQKLGDSFKVQTKEQLNEVFYKVINTENFVSYLIFTLIVIIALFNVIGAIIMMIIDKKQNLKTLFNLGTTIKEIKRIFVLQGFLLTITGMILGLLIGVIAVFIQLKFGLFMITENLAYPVEFRFSNLLIVIFTITTLGFIAAKIASSRISKEFVEK
ncbi:ABC transporter permease [Polaribacter reichenbachii]|uniref:ABC transporter permease n=1 Tax=Polaribacter reichenbachii TaxID=996801 RepID=A0A1B8TVV1_9FLAO|nr:ABC transporter permease [Polaribacter reichenbachii]APZ45261.1 ABC transporter permease [Polaribacter reichenbachii]AUC19124.1 ABC transporter permease [Polaribacter reichenbachii]OBY63720.1 ABC transporter permease [Polaribacter reichenbachii]